MPLSWLDNYIDWHSIRLPNLERAMGQGYLWQFTDRLKIDNHFFDANILYDLRKDTFLHGGDFLFRGLTGKGYFLTTFKLKPNFELGVFVLLGGGNDDFCAEFRVGVVGAPAVPIQLLVYHVDVAGARFFYVDIVMFFEKFNSSTALATVA